MNLLSLKTCMLLGAMLWTIGLFAISGIVHDASHDSAGRGMHHSTFRLWHASPPATALVAALCMLSGFLLVRRGMSPINQLRNRLGAVHKGIDARLGGRYPAEVQPLVNDMNALLDHREEAVSRAVAKADDLAHGLKTPLSVLVREAARVRELGHPDLADAIAEQIDRMRRQMDYHVAHARASASGATPGVQCVPAASIDALARTLRRLHAERGISIDVHVASDHIVRAHRDDVDEMLGNLLDNACKWANSRVSVASETSDAMVGIVVDDDGPGLAASLREAVLQRGVRADEAAPGSGFGLAIVRDLAAVYGGSITLAESPLGGLRARLSLPSC